jgi:ATP-dependent Zn protease
MDGVSGRTGVYIIAATNRPDIIDPALLRPGRLDKALYVPLPDAVARGAILRAAALRSPVAGDVDLGEIAARRACEGFSGADVASMLREAAVASLKVRSACVQALHALSAREQPATFTAWLCNCCTCCPSPNGNVRRAMHHERLHLAELQAHL